ncbi:M15 family metallopeptidase [Deefgea piscis]|uniref:M15 family metallopeptidase n=1 Tax=Deefgea piscis TaxID=2739061 RepID=UPI001C81B39E|nr:M15 family metallopeptidase [Deefgea piscis]QZA80175.1 M15 family metallopeptidase [Deefgea piscis]
MSSRELKDLHASIRTLAAQFVAEANATLQQQNPALEVRLVCTWRPQAEQNALYAQGRTKPGPKVTWVTQSAHNTDLPDTPDGDAEALDIGVFENGKYLQGNTARELGFYLRLGPIGERFGLVWGGRWQTPDYPHFERKEWRTAK